MNQQETIDALTQLAGNHIAAESLTAAAAAGDLAAVQAFVDAGANIEEKSVGFSSPLQAAVQSGCLAVVDFLLSKGARVEKKPDAMFSPISAAATYGHTEIFHRLIALAADTSSERTALVTLASYGMLEELKLLLEKGAMPDGRHAMAAAAKNGHFEMVKYLVDAGVAWKEFTALRIPEGARDAGFIDLFNYLSGQPYDETAALAAGHAARDQKRSSLVAHMKALAGKRRQPDLLERKSLLQRLRKAVSEGVLAPVINKPVISAGNYGMVTPLIVAALAGDVELVKVLLAAGAKPAPKLKGGLTAQALARGPNRGDVVAALSAA